MTNKLSNIDKGFGEGTYKGEMTMRKKHNKHIVNHYIKKEDIHTKSKDKKSKSNGEKGKRV